MTASVLPHTRASARFTYQYPWQSIRGCLVLALPEPTLIDRLLHSTPKSRCHGFPVLPSSPRIDGPSSRYRPRFIVQQQHCTRSECVRVCVCACSCWRRERVMWAMIAKALWFHTFVFLSFRLDWIGHKSMNTATRARRSVDNLIFINTHPLRGLQCVFGSHGNCVLLTAFRPLFFFNWESVHFFTPVTKETRVLQNISP